MKSFNKLLVLSSLLVLLVFSGCKNSSTRSNTTGWAYNDSKQGFFDVKTEFERKTPN